MHPRRDDGSPFLLHSDRTCPRFVLTETYCDDDSHHLITNGTIALSSTLDDFEGACRTTVQLDSDKAVESRQYNISVPKKAVHLIRNPLDTVVSRLVVDIGSNIEDLSREDVITWCNKMDGKFDSEAPASVVRELKESVSSGTALPACYSEYYRYAQFHNRIVSMTRQRPTLPTHTIYYEDYFAVGSGREADGDEEQEKRRQKRQRETFSGLLDFLEFPSTTLSPTAADSAATSLSRKLLASGGRDRQSVEVVVATLIRSYASPTVWERVRRYFPDVTLR